MKKSENCELCIVGAGLSGLNALFAATSYLTRKDKVIIVDKNPGVSGMWQECYNYVHLHKPFRIVSIGNIKWPLKDKDKSYLANKQEIIDYCEYCFQKLKEKVTVVEYFSYTYQNYEEVLVDELYEAHITLKSLSAEKPDVLVKAKRCIKSFGFNVRPDEALKLSSSKVKSITPASPDFLGKEMCADDKPIYIVGGGKTAMDTAYEIAKKLPQRKLHIFIGKGTVFMNRNSFFPKGLHSTYWSGVLSSIFIMELLSKYDGTNEKDIFKYLRQDWFLRLTPQSQNFVGGIISQEEIDTVSRHASQIWNQNLVDVIDEGDTIFIQLRDGTKISVEKDSWFISCTGHITRGFPSFEPCLSPKKTVVHFESKNSSIGVHFFNAYLLIHLWYLGKLSELPICELDHTKIIQKDKQGFLFTSMLVASYNGLVLMKNIPLKIMKVLPNPDKWYPLPRQILGIIKFILYKKKYYKHLLRTLNKVCDRYNVECKTVGQKNFAKLSN